MRVYVPIIAVIGHMEFDVEGEDRLPQAVQSIKDNKLEPTNLVLESYRPNYDAARATPEVERQYDGG